MAKYIVFFTLTEQGIRNFKESPSRVQAAKRVFQEYGATVTDFYAAVGQSFDTFFVVEAPSEDAVVKGALTVASQGNVRTTTTRLYKEDEYRNIAEALPS